jgi:hypothetical protein
MEQKKQFTDIYPYVAMTMLSESDRGCVLFGTQMISDDLDTMLDTAFGNRRDKDSTIKSLFSGYGPLASLSGKLDLAYALGFIDADLRSLINLVRKIRNICAHESGPLTLKDPRLRDVFTQLKTRTHTDNLLPKVDYEQAGLPPEVHDKNEFIRLIAYLLGRLNANYEVIKKKTYGHPIGVAMLALPPRA